METLIKKYVSMAVVAVTCGFAGYNFGRQSAKPEKVYVERDYIESLEYLRVRTKSGKTYELPIFANDLEKHIDKSVEVPVHDLESPERLK